MTIILAKYMSYFAPVGIKVSIEVHPRTPWSIHWRDILPPESIPRVLKPCQLGEAVKSQGGDKAEGFHHYYWKHCMCISRHFI